jgi:hypothetical protein
LNTATDKYSLLDAIVLFVIDKIAGKFVPTGTAPNRIFIKLESLRIW